MPSADVAMVAPYPTADGRVRSGVESYVASLTGAMAKAGAEVVVIAPHEDGEADRRVHDGVRVERSFRRGPAALPAAARAAARSGAPVVHLQHEVFLYGGPASVPGLPWALARLRGAGCPAVVTLHHVVDPAGVDRDFTRLHRVRVPAGPARVALSGVQAAVRRLSSVAVVHEPGFAPVVPGARVIPLGIEPTPPGDRVTERARLGLDDERLTVLCFGFLSPYKGLEAALAAAELAAADVELVVAGGPHPRLVGRDSYADQLVARASTAARFTGFVDDRDVPAWFAAADIVLVPYPRPFSSSGPLGLALGHGRPVLLSSAMAACVGAPELGTSCEPRALAARLVELARHPEARAGLATASSELARGRTWSSVAERHLELYEEVRHGARSGHDRLPVV